VLPSLLFSASAIIIAFYYCLVQLSWVLMDWNGIAAINNFRYSRSCITTLYYILSYRAAQQIKNKYLMPTHGTEKSHLSQLFMKSNFMNQSPRNRSNKRYALSPTSMPESMYREVRVCRIQTQPTHPPGIIRLHLYVLYCNSCVCEIIGKLPSQCSYVCPRFWKFICIHRPATYGPGTRSKACASFLNPPSQRRHA